MYGDTHPNVWKETRWKGYDVHELYLLSLLFQEHNGWMLHEATATMVDQTGKPCTDHTTFRILKQMFHTRKKASTRAFRFDEALVSMHYLV